MKSIRLLDRRAGYSLSAIGLLLGMVAPVALPAFASADVLTSRSVTLSSSVAGADSVSYTTEFTVTTPVAVGGGFIMQFCDGASGPLLGQDCDEPAGMSVAGVAVGTVEINTGAGFAAAADDGTLTSADETGAGNNDNFVKWVSGTGDDLDAGDKLRLEFTGATNPDDPGTFYARIYTYAAGADFSGFVDSTDLGTIADNGSAALSATEGVGITAYVLESMTFCVSKGDVGHVGALTANDSTVAPSENCGANEVGGCAVYQAGCVVSPSMTLGQENGTVTALDSTYVSTGSVYAQLSTNASGGASVNLRSDADDCGGLYRNGISDAGHCNIAPKTTAGSFTAGTANFGLTVGAQAYALTGAGGAGGGSGTVATNTADGYGASDFFIDYDGTDETGITSTYGSKLFSSTGPVNNVNVPITFAAGVSNTTPAGSYGANFNMIATGTY